MRYRIFDKQGKAINVIIAEESFVKLMYSGRYELDEYQVSEEEAPEPSKTIEQRLEDLEAKIDLLLSREVK